MWSIRPVFCAAVVNQWQRSLAQKCNVDDYGVSSQLAGAIFVQRTLAGANPVNRFRPGVVGINVRSMVSDSCTLCHEYTPPPAPLRQNILSGGSNNSTKIDGSGWQDGGVLMRTRRVHIVQFNFFLGTERNILEALKTNRQKKHKYFVETNRVQYYACRHVKLDNIRQRIPHTRTHVACVPAASPIVQHSLLSLLLFC